MRFLTLQRYNTTLIAFFCNTADSNIISIRTSLSRLLFIYSLKNIIIKTYIYLQVTVMSWSTLEKNALEAFDRANLDLINRNLDNFDVDIKYLFPTLPLFVYRVN